MKRHDISDFIYFTMLDTLDLLFLLRDRYRPTLFSMLLGFLGVGIRKTEQRSTQKIASNGLRTFPRKIAKHPEISLNLFASMALIGIWKAFLLPFSVLVFKSTLHFLGPVVAYAL
jgi:hypothetical protein